MKPEFPAAAKERTEEGALAFAEYYWAAVNYAWTKPDNEILEILSTADCEACTSLQSSAEKFLDSNSRFSAPPLEVKSADLAYLLQNEAQVVTKVKRTRASTVDKQGNILHTNEPGEATRTFRLLWDGRWRVVGIGDS